MRQFGAVWAIIEEMRRENTAEVFVVLMRRFASARMVKEAFSYCSDMLDADVMLQLSTFAKLMKGLKKVYNRLIAAEITVKVRITAADRQMRQMIFIMYQRRGERDLKEKTKAQTDGKREGVVYEILAKAIVKLTLLFEWSCSCSDRARFDAWASILRCPCFYGFSDQDLELKVGRDLGQDMLTVRVSDLSSSSMVGASAHMIDVI